MKWRANNQFKAQKAAQETAAQSGRTQLGLTLRNGNDRVPCHAPCPKNRSCLGDVDSREKGCSPSGISVLTQLTTLFNKALHGYV